MKGSKTAGSQDGDRSPLPVIWRPRAQLDRESLLLRLGVELGNKKAAVNAFRAISDAVERIGEFPGSGRQVDMDGLDHGDYRVVYARPYRIFYRIVAERAIIYRILHERQDIDTYALVDIPKADS